LISAKSIFPFLMPNAIPKACRAYRVPFIYCVFCRRSFAASSSKVVAAASTAALSLLSIVVIVFVRIPFEIKSRLCLLVVHGLKIHGQHNWKQLCRGWPRVVGKTRVRIQNNSYILYTRISLYYPRIIFSTIDFSVGRFISIFFLSRGTQK
jgi:hypothetical protein